ncbi:MAG TPA: phosphoenolpyruvate carboxykinase (ATP) [Candidatus Anaerostipes avistercoris]|uniref:phosphoenolpyruvate carboxykinase (ATP) n=1 Tax=Candidatus Anaerostipes avistercoris TaxID=2838462 RepID=A0A9D2T9R7_9FIRM|nr:phosphoenolpyruvate carboxykinase (ATP) [Candidatus Anaerostipes avistercoris]
MSTKAYYKHDEIGKGKPGFSKTRSIIEAAFYGNNVVEVKDLKQAYELAKDSPGTIVTDMPVYKPEAIGLDEGTKVLLFNDGSVTGRCAAARRIASEPGVDTNALDLKVMDAVYDTRWSTLYHAQVYIGLDPEFMVKAHLLIPEGEENILYSWMLNFQYESVEYNEMYNKSRPIGDETDIYIFSDPQWQDKDYPLGLTYFNTDTNCAALLGMKYFGEHKKGTLTIAWAIANRNGYASCHGGQKEYQVSKDRHFVASFFGLSGSGKSTLTHAMHDNKYENITVLHDDAFIINTETGASIAMEPTYFDKTADYPTGCPDNKYLLTAQNCSATLDDEGKVVLVTEDIRNGNGRAIKSKLWSENRVDRIDSPVSAIFWIMKDPTIPPLVKIEGASLASVMGATLATKRTTAERLAPGVDPDRLVVEPYANPFRTYPLVNDYKKFRDLVRDRHVECYILNTGDFMGKDIEPSVTLSCIEQVVEGTAEFKPWGPFSSMRMLEVEGYIPDFTSQEYVDNLKARMTDRLNFVFDKDVEDGGYDRLPTQAKEALAKVIGEAHEMMAGDGGMGYQR